MARLKNEKRLLRLVSCIKKNNLKRLRHYIKRRKYVKLNLEETVVNKKGETLLHIGCRLLKPEIVTFLLDHFSYNEVTVDHKGNLPLHLALKSLLKIEKKDIYINVYRSVILPLLGRSVGKLSEKNYKGQSLEQLLDVADTLFQHYCSENAKTLPRSSLPVTPELDEWASKLEDVLDDEYQASWGRYEQDFYGNYSLEKETYDAWAERMIYEHRKKQQSLRAPVQIKTATSPSASKWTEDDQKRFLKEEEARKEMQKRNARIEKRLTFLSKLSFMSRGESSTIGRSDLPFSLNDEADAICELIMMNVNEEPDESGKKKLHRELQRLWHPDKFSQKFASRLSEDIRDRVLHKVTQISQCLNAYQFN